MSSVFKEMQIKREEAGDIGLEIEVEGKYLPKMGKLWRTEADGSLKGEESAEYVLAAPGSMKDVQAALDQLEAAYVHNETRVDNTVRAGVHVHINCQRLTMTQLYNFITVYLILENLLVKWCGEFREGNLFCLRTCDAEWMLQVIRSAANDPKKMYKNRFHRDELRYASMNLKALGDYGSLEFRAMRGTRDLSLIYSWAETLYGLREFACGFDKPSDIVEAFSIRGPERFIEDALGKNTAQFMHEDYLNLVWKGLRNAQDVAYCTDWMVFEPKMRKIGQLEFPENIPAGDINEPEEDF